MVSSIRDFSSFMQLVHFPGSRCPSAFFFKDLCLRTDMTSLSCRLVTEEDFSILQCVVFLLSFYFILYKKYQNLEMGKSNEPGYSIIFPAFAEASLGKPPIQPSLKRVTPGYFCASIPHKS